MSEQGGTAAAERRRERDRQRYANMSPEDKERLRERQRGTERKRRLRMTPEQRRAKARRDTELRRLREGWGPRRLRSEGNEVQAAGHVVRLASGTKGQIYFVVRYRGVGVTAQKAKGPRIIMGMRPGYWYLRWTDPDTGEAMRFAAGMEIESVLQSAMAVAELYGARNRLPSDQLRRLPWPSVWERDGSRAAAGELRQPHMALGGWDPYARGCCTPAASEASQATDDGHSVHGSAAFPGTQGKARGPAADEAGRSRESNVTEGANAAASETKGAFQGGNHV